MLKQNVIPAAIKSARFHITFVVLLPKKILKPSQFYGPIINSENQTINVTAEFAITAFNNKLKTQRDILNALASSTLQSVHGYYSYCLYILMARTAWLGKWQN